MAAEIRTLDPRPGAIFTAGIADPVVPDVIVRAASDGSWAVELNSETLPRVLVDNVYYAQVLAKSTQATDREFLAECMQNANWLARSLDQRARTILKVAAEIVRQRRTGSWPTACAICGLEPENRGRCDRHARIDHQPRHQQFLCA
jgi:RNA polymerase sigma-54 factor